jgi:hypothetical protein
MAADQNLDLDRDLPVTPEDVEALRRLRAEAPSWLLLDWRQLQALLPPDVSTRPVANDDWQPFSLV